MHTTRLRRTGALLTAAALLASLTAATVAAPTTAAKPRCMGKVATHVGTKKADVIRGTKKADVIVAKGGNDTVRGKGGNDLICGGGGKDKLYGDGGNDKIRGDAGNDTAFGGSGRDKLFGNEGNDKLWGNTAADWLFGGSGRDRLEGQGGDDALDGGPAVDVCRQGVGSGRRVRCELPVPLAPPPPPEAKTLVIAYSDINNNQMFDAGDVMIAKIVDTDKSGTISPTDTIKMGQYPTSPAVVTPAGVRGAFEDWGVKSHIVDTVDSPASDVKVQVTNTTGGRHSWFSNQDNYYENTGVPESNFYDNDTVGGTDEVYTDPITPSQPASSFNVSGPGLGDDGFIDVIFY